MFKRSLSYIRDKNKRNFFIYGVGQAFNLLSPLLVAPLVILICNEEGFGKVGLGFSLALFAMLIVDYAFEIKGIKQVSERRDDNEALSLLLTTTLFTKFILFILTAAAAMLAIYSIGYLRAEKTLFIYSLAIVFAQVFNPVWFLQGAERFTLASLLNIGSKVLYVFLVYNFVRENDDYIYVNLYLGASALLFNLTGLLLIYKKLDFRIGIPKLSAITSIIRHDFTFCISQLFLSVRQLSPLVLTGYFLGYGVAGQYKVIEQIITLYRTFIQVFLKFFFPKACYKMLGDLPTGIRFWKRYSSMVLVITSVSLVLIFIFAKDILQYFNVSPLLVIQLKPILQFSLVVSLLMSLSLPFEQLMFLLNKNTIYIRIAIFVTVANVATILLLINRFELEGLLSSMILSEALFIALYYRYTLSAKHKKLV